MRALVSFLFVLGLAVPAAAQDKPVDEAPAAKPKPAKKPKAKKKAKPPVRLRSSVMVLTPNERVDDIISRMRRARQAGAEGGAPKFGPRLDMRPRIKAPRKRINKRGPRIRNRRVRDRLGNGVHERRRKRARRPER